MVIENNKYPPRFGIISFLDILGTKSIWEDNKAEEFLTKVNRLYDEFDQLRNLGEVLLRLKDANYKVKDVDFTPYKEIRTIPKLGLDISTFSDTLILALHGPKSLITDSFFLYLTGFFLIPLFRLALVEKVYLRGTVSIGKFFLLKRDTGVVMVGPAVNDAAQSYENAEWIGISASPSASLTLEQENTIDSLLEIDMSASIEGLSIDLKRFYHMEGFFYKL